MIRIFSFATATSLGLATLGIAAFAAPARADDVHVEFGVGVRDGRVSGGFIGVGTGAPVRLTPRPRSIPEPAPFGSGAGRPDRPLDPRFGVDARHTYASAHVEPRPQFIPGHMESRSETICEPAVYEDRCVPIFEERCIPIFDNVRVPIFEDRRVPRVEWVNDLRTSQLKQVVVGMRTVREKVGERVERRKVGERHEQVQVGTRIEHVLVRAEFCRVVTREEWVPGRYVTAHAHDRHDRHDRHDGSFRDGGFRERSDRDGGVREEMPRDRVRGQRFDRARYETEEAPAPYVARR